MMTMSSKLSHRPEIDSGTLWHRQRGWQRRTPGPFLSVICPGGRKEHGLGLVLPLQPLLGEDKGEEVGKVVWVVEEERKPGGVMRVVVVIGEEGQGIQWTQTEEKSWDIGEEIQRNWVFEQEGSGKGNIGGTERDESTVPRRPAHMGPQTIYGFDGKICQDQ
jgi:hypothetical protein